MLFLALSYREEKVPSLVSSAAVLRSWDFQSVVGLFYILTKESHTIWAVKESSRIQHPSLRATRIC